MSPQLIDIDLWQAAIRQNHIISNKPNNPQRSHITSLIPYTRISFGSW